MAKRILFTSILILSSFGLFAQRYQWRPQVHELSVEPIGLRFIPAYASGYEQLPMGVHLPRAIRYAYNLNYTSAIRLGVFRQRARFDLPTPATRTETGFQAGYAYKYTNRRSQIQFGGDAIVAQGNVEWFPIIASSPSTTSYQSFGAQVFTAYRHYFSQYFSITGEAALNYLRHTYSSEPAEANLPDYDISFSPSDFGFIGSIYLTVHFGKMKTKNCGCSH